MENRTPPFRLPNRENRAKAAMSTATMVDPTGVPARMDIRIPVNAQMTESMAEHMVTDRKLLNRRMADSAGKITRAEISREPTRFMASTMITAMMTAIRRLYIPAFTPVACAKPSSKVTAKILL